MLLIWHRPESNGVNAMQSWESKSDAPIVGALMPAANNEKDAQASWETGALSQAMCHLSPYYVLIQAISTRTQGSLRP